MIAAIIAQAIDPVAVRSLGPAQTRAVSGYSPTEKRPEGILLRSVKDDRLSWEETARAMAAEQGGEFADLEKAAAADGLSTLDQ